MPIMLPRGSDRRTIVLLTFALLALISTNLAPAQVFNLERDHVQMTGIPGPWRFHTGDSPLWSDPAFDDSHWPLIRADQGWSSQGFQGYAGVAWYRIDLQVPAQHPPLALYIPNVDVSCEVFANGTLIGKLGGLPPHPLRVSVQSLYLAIPDELGRSRHLKLAIRVWNDPNYRNSIPGGLNPAPLIGDRQAIEQWRWLQERRLFWENSFVSIELGFNLLGMFACLGLFALRRKEREYLWFSLVLLAWSINQILQLHSTFFPDPFYPMQWLLVFSYIAGFFGLPVFLTSLFRQAWGWLICGCAFGCLLMGLFLLLGNYWPAAPVFPTASMLAFTAFLLFTVLIIVKAWRAGNREARIVALPIAPEGIQIGIFFLTGLFPQNSFFAGLTGFITSGIQWPVPVPIQSLTGDFSNACVLAVLILRFARTRHDEERFKGELEAARTVQQVLIPEEIPAIPGLALECVYKPAGQVGGDFFQILPTTNNGALVVIGDVSGKGMPAAMAVSLLVGTVRTLAHYTHSPGEILTAMNQRMLARSKDGFTTCLVLRLDHDGSATVSNAGHLAPYLGATEVPVESGLPLGLAAQAEYTESSFHLDTGGEITLVTDGVAEARAKTGELFGFERAASIAVLSNAHIAATAAAFGQQDDITVLKIRRLLVPQPALADPVALPLISATLESGPQSSHFIR